MKDYRQIIADDNIHMKNLYKTIESQQQEIETWTKRWANSMELVDELRQEIEQKDEALKLARGTLKRLGYTDTNAKILLIDKALGGTHD